MRTESLSGGLALLLIVPVSGCGGGGDSGHVGSSGSGSGATDGFPVLTNAVDPEPGPTNTLMRVFSRPFSGEYDVL
ncbi:MAG TPA: hypothetical protein VMF89_34110, partial [Polyangiales bacterium]|nr:hypothetical protein [Polyangiales bacterium]